MFFVLRCGGVKFKGRGAIRVARGQGDGLGVSFKILLFRFDGARLVYLKGEKGTQFPVHRVQLRV